MTSATAKTAPGVPGQHSRPHPDRREQLTSAGQSRWTHLSDEDRRRSALEQLITDIAAGR